MASHQLRATTDATRDTADALARPERERDDHEREDAGSSNSLFQASKRDKGDGDKDNTHAQDDDQHDAQLAAKKRRISTTATKAKGTARVKGKKGKLSTFLAMPLDLLVEVAQHTDPPTLLAMSRTNKLMHNLFARRSAAPIWAAVRRNVDFPELEATDLSEMQLASLVFDRNCHLCGRGRAVIVDYALRIRWCKSCERANLVRETDLQRLKLHRLAPACSFLTFHSGKNRIVGSAYYCVAQLRAVSDHLFKLEAEDDKLHAELALGMPRAAPRPMREIMWADPTALSLVEKHVVECRHLPDQVQEDAAALVKWDGATPLAREAALVAADQLRYRKDFVRRVLVPRYVDDADMIIRRGSPILELIREPTLPVLLSDEDLQPLLARIHMLAEGHRVDRLDRERVWRIWRRHDALKPRYSVLRSTGADEIRLSVPSWSNFRLLPSVEPLWLPEGDVVSDEQWQAALPSILADLATARRVLKVAYARRVVEPLVKAGALTDSSLADALKASKRPLKPTGALFDETDFGDYERVHRHFSRMYMDGPVGFLDLGDKADGVDELELDALLSQAVATFVHVGSSGQATLVPFPDIVPMLDKYGSRPEAVDDGQLETPSVQFIQQQLDVLERAGLPNHRSSVAELEALGPVFECHGCGVAAPAASDGVKSSSLCWSEMLRHACTVHRDFYAASGEHLPSAVPEIRLSTSTYPPDSPVPPPASSTTAVADVATA